jgi:hypothetical protein
LDSQIMQRLYAGSAGRRKVAKARRSSLADVDRQPSYRQILLGGAPLAAPSGALSEAPSFPASHTGGGGPHTSPGAQSVGAFVQSDPSVSFGMGWHVERPSLLWSAEEQNDWEPQSASVVHGCVQP